MLYKTKYCAMIVIELLDSQSPQMKIWGLSFGYFLPFVGQFLPLPPGKQSHARPSLSLSRLFQPVCPAFLSLSWWAWACPWVAKSLHFLAASAGWLIAKTARGNIKWISFIGFSLFLQIVDDGLLNFILVKCFAYLRAWISFKHKISTGVSNQVLKIFGIGMGLQCF